MSEIIEFPGGAEFFRRNIERTIDESLVVSDPDVKTCIKKRVGETLSKYRGIPSLQISLALSLSEPDEKKLTEALAKEYNEKVSKFAMELIKEICLLQAQLCRCEHGR
jgi:hypothetical protein